MCSPVYQSWRCQSTRMIDSTHAGFGLGPVMGKSIRPLWNLFAHDLHLRERDCRPPQVEDELENSILPLPNPSREC